jgi:hypothetical protein
LKFKLINVTKISQRGAKMKLRLRPVQSQIVRPKPILGRRRSVTSSPSHRRTGFAQAPNLDGRRTTACGLGIAETQSCADCIATGPHAHHSAPTRCTHRCGTDQSLQSRPPAYCGDDTKSESVVATRAPATHAESNKPSMIKQATAAACPACPSAPCRHNVRTSRTSLRAAAQRSRPHGFAGGREQPAIPARTGNDCAMHTHD